MMVTLASTCLCAMLAWLVATDGRLTWLNRRHSNITNQKHSSQSKAENTRKSRNAEAKVDSGNLQGFLRLAAYAVIAALLWSWSPNADIPHNSNVHAAEPSFRVNMDPLDSSTNSFPQESDASWTAARDEQGSASDEEAEEAAHVATIHNATLGFEKIFVVNLPERADKRDALSLVSALTDIRLTWTSALRGTSVPDKALPLGVDRKGWRDGGIGSWRSQMNVIRTMVEENISSALILEDDADWDVRIKDQLGFISRGTRILLDMAHKEPAFASKLTPAQRVLDDLHSAHSPYGQGWDILWLGHCGETFPERIPGHHHIHDRSSARYTYYAMEDDETLPLEPAAVTESWISGDLARHRGTRWVHFSGGPTCSQAYALSQTGARKILLALSVGGTLVEQLDNAMSLLCRDHTPWDSPNDVEGPPGYPGANMRCLSVNPAVVSQHKPRGRKAAESDIETVDEGEEIREAGESPNLVYSARLNVQNLMMGRPLQEQKVAVVDEKPSDGEDKTS